MLFVRGGFRGQSQQLDGDTDTECGTLLRYSTTIKQCKGSKTITDNHKNPTCFGSRVQSVNGKQTIGGV